MIKANQNKVYFLKKLKVLTQVIFHRNTTCLNRTNVRHKLGSKLKYRGMNSGLELVKNFCKVLTCIDGQRVILKLFLVNRLGCNLVYNSHNPDRFIITRVKFWFLSKNHHRRWLKIRLFSKESLGSPTYFSNRTWKTFNSRLPGGILMPLAMIHLTYLSELCFKMFLWSLWFTFE